MDGVNVYLGLGIVVLLTAAFQGTQALDIPLSAPTRAGAQILLAAAGIAVVVAAYTAPLPGTATAPIADYRDQVRSSCGELRRIAASGAHAVLFNAKGQIDTVAMLDLLRRQSAQHDATLTALWAEDPPRSLRGDRDEAIERSARSSDVLFDVLAHVEATQPRWATQADVDRAFGYRQQEARRLTTEADRALSDLADEVCMTS